MCTGNCICNDVMFELVIKFLKRTRMLIILFVASSLQAKDPFNPPDGCTDLEGGEPRRCVQDFHGVNCCVIILNSFQCRVQ